MTAVGSNDPAAVFISLTNAGSVSPDAVAAAVTSDVVAGGGGSHFAPVSAPVRPVIHLFDVDLGVVGAVHSIDGDGELIAAVTRDASHRAAVGGGEVVRDLGDACGCMSRHAAQGGKHRRNGE